MGNKLINNESYKFAGTSGWLVPISQSQTTVFVGQWMEWDSLPPCISIKIRKGEDRRKKKREALHLFRCYTHTHAHAHTHTLDWFWDLKLVPKVVLLEVRIEVAKVEKVESTDFKNCVNGSTAQHWTGTEINSSNCFGAGTHGWSICASWDSCKELRWAELCKSPLPRCIFLYEHVQLTIPCARRVYTHRHTDTHWHAHTHTALAVSDVKLHDGRICMDKSCFCQILKICFCQKLFLTCRAGSKLEVQDVPAVTPTPAMAMPPVTKQKMAHK